MTMAMEDLLVRYPVPAAQATGKDVIDFQVISVQKHQSTVTTFPLLLG